ncbi:MAG: DUF559 domain-containing protein [Nanoarchaeota archaeon]
MKGPKVGYKQTEEHKRKRLEAVRLFHRNNPGRVSGEKNANYGNRMSLESKIKRNNKIKELRKIKPVWNKNKKCPQISIGVKKAWQNPNSGLHSIQRNEKLSNAAIKSLKSYKRYTSFPEQQVMEILKFSTIFFIPQYQIEKYAYDFYLPHFNTIIEVDGDYWHSRPEVKEKDKIKTNVCHKYNFNLLRIKECDLKNDYYNCYRTIISFIGGKPF